MAAPSLAWTLDRIRPHLSDPIVRPAAWVKLRAAAAHLPAALTSCIYVESWLHGEPSRVDFIIRVDETGRSMLADRPSPAWRTLSAFSSVWGRPGSPLERGIAALWLEFDVGAATRDACLAGAVPPRLFVDFRPEPSRDASVDDRFALAVGAAALLRGAPVSSAVTRRLRVVFEALPSGATIRYVGLPLGDQAVRVCVAGLKDALPDYLNTVGWPDDVDRLARIVHAPAGGSFGLVHIDVASDLLPAIGLEYACPRVFPYLVERGFCAPAIRDALVAWPGQTIEHFAHRVWCSRLVRRVNHVKVVYDAGHVRAVKAYLCCAERPHASGVAAARLANRASFAAAGRYSVDGELVSAADRHHVESV
jgi:hypothetical protein